MKVRDVMRSMLEYAAVNAVDACLWMCNLAGDDHGGLCIFWYTLANKFAWLEVKLSDSLHSV